MGEEDNSTREVKLGPQQAKHTSRFLSLTGVDKGSQYLLHYAYAMCTQHERRYMSTKQQVLQLAMKANQGVIKEFSVDDKGTVMVGALGLPPITGSNPSARACVTALKIMKGIQVYSIFH